MIKKTLSLDGIKINIKKAHDNVILELYASGKTGLRVYDTDEQIIDDFNFLKKAIKGEDGIKLVIVDLISKQNVDLTDVVIDRFVKGETAIEITNVIY